MRCINLNKLTEVRTKIQNNIITLKHNHDALVRQETETQVTEFIHEQISLSEEIRVLPGLSSLRTQLPPSSPRVDIDIQNLEFVYEQLSLSGGLRGAFLLASSYPQLPLRLIPLPEDNTFITDFLVGIEQVYGINLIEDFETPPEVNIFTNIIGSFSSVFTSLLGCLLINYAQIHPHNDDPCG